MNVFVLCSGRTASTTFARAANLISGFTADHESRSRLIGADRLNYPMNHIEVDNRLAWFLGAIDKKYGDNAHYVFLRRDRAAIARSYEKRWYLTVSIVKAFQNAILMAPYEGYKKSDVCRFYVDTVEDNISSFLKDKTNVFIFDMDNAKDEYIRFCCWLGVDVPEDGVKEWGVFHNTNQELGLYNKLIMGLRKVGRIIVAAIKRNWG